MKKGDRVLLKNLDTVLNENAYATRSDGAIYFHSTKIGMSINVEMKKMFGKEHIVESIRGNGNFRITDGWHTWIFHKSWANKNINILDVDELFSEVVL